MIRETLGTLRSDNGDTNENVAEKSGPMKLFPRRYTKSPIYLKVGKLGWSWIEVRRSGITVLGKIHSEILVSFILRKDF